MARSLLTTQSPNLKQIVQCPACQAKYALDAKTIESITNPRFHCSRCDNIFEVQSPTESPEARHLKLSKNIPAPLVSHDTPGEEFDFQEFKSEASQSYQKQSLDTDTSSYSLYSKPAARPEAPQQMRALDIPRKFQSGLVNAPHEAQPTSSKFQESFSFDQPRQAMHAPPVPDLQMPTREILKSRPNSINRMFEKPKGDRWMGFIGFATPLFLLLAVLAGTSFYLAANPARAHQIGLSIFGNLPCPAPEGLMVNRVSFKPVTLDSGEIVYFLTGEIVNNSNKTLRDIQVEGLAFDKRGNLLDKLLVKSGGTLASTRIQSLSTEMISSLQNAKTPKRINLTPGTKQQFAIALMNPALNKAQYFSARVYSVRLS